MPSPDNVQEFKVQQHSFTSQYGWSTGNVVTVVTKSGTSSLHGDIYEFLRNGNLDAKYYFNNGAKPISHRSQYGAAVGGPVYLPGIYKERNKTFFFFNYEAHRENAALDSGLNTVPIAAFRTGDFSSLLGPQIGTDLLGRPIRQGQIYDPFTSRQVTAGQVDPKTGLPFANESQTIVAQTLLKSGKRSWASSACFLPRMARVKIQTSSIFMSAVSIELSECSE